jgi:tetratricopeptide (TPR) repeat protein
MLGQVLINVGDLNIRHGRVEQAGAALEEARALLQAEYGEALSGAAAWRLAILNSVAGSYEIERGRFAEAERHLAGAWPVLRTRFGARSYFGDQCLVHLSRLYYVQGNAKAAREYQALLRSRPEAG